MSYDWKCAHSHLSNPVHGLDPLESGFVIRDEKYSINCFDGLQIPENVCKHIQDDTPEDDNRLDVYSSTDKSDESDEAHRLMM